MSTTFQSSSLFFLLSVGASALQMAMPMAAQAQIPFYPTLPIYPMPPVINPCLLTTKDPSQPFNERYCGDPSCKVLMGKLYASVYPFTMQNLTNDKLLVGAYTQGILRRNGDLLTGTTQRLYSNRFVPNPDTTLDPFGIGTFVIPQPFDINQTDELSYQFNLVSASLQSGGRSYKLTCVGDTYAIADTGGSLETYLFVSTPFAL
jgi:hypothetical protein